MRIKAALEEIKRCQFRARVQVQKGPRLEGDLQAVLELAFAVGDDTGLVEIAAR